jgi:hypothetical protein
VSDPVTLKLSAPIQRISKTTGEVVDAIAELTFRPLKFGDMVAAMDASEGKQGTLVLHLAARSCGMSASDIEGLPMADFAPIMAVVTGFMPAGLPTGPTG